MPQLPRPPSKRRTQARIKKLDALYNKLLSDPRLQICTTERDLCLKVQEVLDDFVKETFRPRSLRNVTWGQQTSNASIPRVEVGSHNYYPDHIIWRNDFTIAIEIKRYTGSSSTLQQIIGQSVIYSQSYGFVIVYIADVTEEGNLAKHLNSNPLDKQDDILLRELWWYHNTAVVCRKTKEVAAH
jgi:hypothetical protein